MTRVFADILDWAALDADARRAALARPARRTDAAVAGRVAEILSDVRARGGPAVREWAERIDGFAPRRLVVDAAAVAAARDALAPADTRALRIAADNIRVFHEATRPDDTPWVETTPGVRSRIAWRPLRAAGLYVPGGSAPLFSSLLMQAIPAQVAEVERRVVVTPPDRSGGVHPAMILAAAEAEVEALWLIGGAQAIAALTFGARLDDGEIAPCDKLFGPGNAWVAEAKSQAAAVPGGPAIDMPAGPSELMIVVDRDAAPEIVAADLLSQAEHDADAQVVLVSTSRATIDYIAAEVEAQLADLPRAEIARASLAQARAVLVRDLDAACAAVNAYAPEHLSLQVEAPEDLIPAIRAAGAVFVGRFAAETLGDYAAGPSHVLPTDGAARTYGGLAVDSFMTRMSIQTVTAAGARSLGPVAARLARLEGLEAHARAADLRADAG